MGRGARAALVGSSLFLICGCWAWWPAFAFGLSSLRRGSLGKMGDYEAVLGEVRRSDMMRGIWSSYVSASPYAEGVDFEEAVDSAIELARLSELDDLD